MGYTREPLESKKICLSPMHNPPGHMVFQPGYVHTWTCPACGKSIQFTSGAIY